ncbi:hypothetical protein EDB86DRAFT_2838907 [Lactarius hatsudake]|nr:hypothetical protein EDB86DRAFT_2838907 [Lactarius hatsudake]
MERPVNVSPQTPGRMGSSESATQTRQQSCAAPIPAPGFALVFHTSAARSPVSPASTVTYPMTAQTWMALKKGHRPRRQIWRVGDGLDALGGGTRRTKDMIALHDLVHDKDSQGASAEHSEQFEGDNGWVSNASACIRCGVFAPYPHYMRISEAGMGGVATHIPGRMHLKTQVDSPAVIISPGFRVDSEPSKTSQMRLMTSQSMPGVIGDTDGVDTDGVQITHWVMSLDVRERYSPDKGGERVTGVSGSISNDGELDGASVKWEWA